MTKAQIGTVSHATLRPQDLIPTFAAELKRINPECFADLKKYFSGGTEGEGKVAHRVLSKERVDDDHSFWESETATWLLGHLFDLLEEQAPPYCYFGATEGDGACFGFWVDMDSVNEAVEFEELLKVSGLSDIPPDHVGMVLDVNDHGNCTLYEVDNGEIIEEYWSIV